MQDEYGFDDAFLHAEHGRKRRNRPFGLNSVPVREGLQLTKGRQRLRVKHCAVGFIRCDGVQHEIHESRKRHRAAVRSPVLEGIIQIKLFDLRLFDAEPVRHFSCGHRCSQLFPVGEPLEICCIFTNAVIDVGVQGFVREDRTGNEIHKFSRGYCGRRAAGGHEIQHADDFFVNPDAAAQFIDRFAHFPGVHFPAERIGIAEHARYARIRFQAGNNAVDARFVFVWIENNNGVVLGENVRHSVLAVFCEVNRREALQNE